MKNNMYNNKKYNKECSVYEKQIDWLLQVWRKQKGKTFIVLNDEQESKRFTAYFKISYKDCKKKNSKYALKSVLERMIRDNLLEKSINIKTEIRYYLTVLGMSKHS